MHTARHPPNHLLVIAFFAFVSQAALAQAPLSEITRDPTAVGVVQKAFSALGGKTVWSEVKSARVVLSTLGADGAVTQRTMQFDWTLPELRSRLDFAGGRRIVSDPLRSAVTTNTDIEGNRVRGRTIWLPDELPGLAFYLVLADARWEIAPVQPTKRHPEERIAFRRRTLGLPDMATEQDWAFDSPTGRPTSVISYAPTLSHSGLFLEMRTDYSGFSTALGPMAPTTINKTYGQSRPTTVTVQAITFGQGLPKTAFNLDGGTPQ